MMRRAPPITPAIIGAKRLLEVGLVFGKRLGVFSSGKGVGGSGIGLGVFSSGEGLGGKGIGLGVFSSGEGLGGTVMGLNVFTVSLVVITVALLDELEPFAEAFTEDVGLVALDSDVESGPFAVAFTETVVEVLVDSDDKRLLGVVVFAANG
ncbi:hypothetical protein NC653_026778 [Populus alba x Populus x berolinensis]|uniref:Uncharacterized protein n=2 Tax=Populus TaxID=3689 RepID=A0A4U5MY98_POPAL|nr:hypothetical protein NC653_026778 [Populus alba x Populus x berolinensis]TKR74960.1 hypothetical protein D5086_0000290010 [Populus alba]